MRRILEQIASVITMGTLLISIWALLRWQAPVQTQWWAESAADVALHPFDALAVSFVMSIVATILLTISGVIGHFSPKRKR